MPVTPTFPGVYIEEISSGVRTITGVATSITAFLGRALRGPVNEAVTINNFGDFERIFGGLWAGSSLGFAVRDFYLNGGSQAIVVRLFHPLFGSTSQAQARAGAKAAADLVAAAALAKTDPQEMKDEADKKADEIEADPASKPWVKEAARAVANAALHGGATKEEVTAAVTKAQGDAPAQAAPIIRASLPADKDSKLLLEAASEGAWGNELQARVDHDLSDAANLEGLFNLFVRDGGTGLIEVFRNVSVDPAHPRSVTRVLASESKLVRTQGTPPPKRPDTHPPPAQGKSVWDDDSTHTKVAEDKKASDGTALDVLDFTGPGTESGNLGLFALQRVDLFNLLCVPPYKAATGIPNQDIDVSLIDAAAAFCKRRRAFLIIDPPSAWTDKDKAKTGIVAGGAGSPTNYAAVFFPRLRQPNPLHDNQIETFAPCGAVAGVFARIDAQRGVWKAPAGLEATLIGVPDLSVKLDDPENGELNPLGVNCLRFMPAAGRVVWGARTREGDDRRASEWKYIPVRRVALFIEESLYRGTQWVVFEPNDEPLWAQIRLNVGAFMQNLFRQGAFQGASPREAYLVKCDKETTTQNDINLGIVNIVVGFAPLKPAEFVILKIQQLAGQIET
ncbi:MAG TPA: phage tail sheath C-terminal domain-containing protein [Thermoanaerobaculia bacterium]|nr:phage tail sheath C-terminal domain-containing protein [Thermoanaerobaculia bacterium]